MELTGTVTQICALESGESKAGKAWQKQTFVVETEGTYPKKVAVNVFGEEKIYKFGVKEGDRVTYSLDISSREYNERWYSEIGAWKCTVLSSNGSAQGNVSLPPAAVPNAVEVDEDDLPF